MIAIVATMVVGGIVVGGSNVRTRQPDRVCVICALSI